MTTETTGLKIKLIYKDNKGSCTISNLIKTANNADLIQVAQAYEMIQLYKTDRLVKTLETKLIK